MDWVERVAKLRQWTRSGIRAPHKPLLLLYALGRFQKDAGGGLRYSTVEQDLQRLLAEYGPPNRTTPAYPFHHLVSDGVWEVRTDRGPGSPGSRVRDLTRSADAARVAPALGQGARSRLGVRAVGRQRPGLAAVPGVIRRRARRAVRHRRSGRTRGCGGGRRSPDAGAPRATALLLSRVVGNKACRALASQL
jgi:hypothetical protein